MKGLAGGIQNILHFFHKPFSGFISRHKFRYLAAGSFLAFLDAFMFFILFRLIFHRQPVNIAGYAIKAHDLALWILFPVNVLLGFLSSKYVVFPGSHLPHGTQLLRYFMLVIVAFFISNVVLNFFIETCRFPGVLSKLMTTAVVAFFSYLWQRFYSFKTKDNVPHE